MRSTPLPAVVYLEGVAFWAPTLPDWDTARAVFGAGAPSCACAAHLPSAELLASADRRRAPATVVLSFHVAARAVSMSGLDPRALSSVFASAHGDLAVTDAVCKMLAHAPEQTSPTRFLNSVHNAASGYWAIATGCQMASTAVSARDCSFATGLLEALCQCATAPVPVLLVAYDIEAVGPLAAVNDSRGRLATALVLSPTRTARSLHAVEWAVSNSTSPSRPPSPAAIEAGLSRNGIADALPFFEALSQTMPTELRVPLSSGMALQLCLQDLRPQPLRATRLQPGSVTSDAPA